MNKQKNYVKFLLLTALTILTTGCSEEAVSKSNAEVPAVKVMTVGQQVSSEMYSGKILPDQEIQIVSKISGRVAKVAVEEGAIVHKGQELVSLEADDYRQQVLQAKAGLGAAQAKLADLKAGTRSQQITQQQSQLEQAKAIFNTTQKTYERYKNLYDSGAISQGDLEKVTLDLEKAQAALDQATAQLDLLRSGATVNSIAAQASEVNRAQASLSQAQISLANSSIVSPMDGIVVKRLIDPGEMAQAGTGLLTLVRMEQVKVEVSVSQVKVNQIRVGDKTTVRVDGPSEQVFEGKVTFISPVSDPNSSTFPVKVVVDNRQGMLKAGMIAKVSFTGEQQTGWEVPVSALFTENHVTYLYVVKDDILRKTAVTVKPKNKEWVHVTDGLNNHDQIVIIPDKGLSDGMKVKIAKGV